MRTFVSIYFFSTRQKLGTLASKYWFGTVSKNISWLENLSNAFELGMWGRYQKWKQYHAVGNHLEHPFVCFRLPRRELHHVRTVCTNVCVPTAARRPSVKLVSVRLACPQRGKSPPQPAYGHAIAALRWGSVRLNASGHNIQNWNMTIFVQIKTKRLHWVQRILFGSVWQQQRRSPNRATALCLFGPGRHVGMSNCTFSWRTS